MINKTCVNTPNMGNVYLSSLYAITYFFHWDMIEPAELHNNYALLCIIEW